MKIACLFCVALLLVGKATAEPQLFQHDFHLNPPKSQSSDLLLRSKSGSYKPCFGSDRLVDLLLHSHIPELAGAAVLQTINTDMQMSIPMPVVEKPEPLPHYINLQFTSVDRLGEWLGLTAKALRTLIVVYDDVDLDERTRIFYLDGLSTEQTLGFIARDHALYLARDQDGTYFFFKKPKLEYPCELILLYSPPAK